MDIEFTCGHVAKNVGMIGLACQAHIGQCTDEACQAETKRDRETYRNR